MEELKVFVSDLILVREREEGKKGWIIKNIIYSFFDAIIDNSSTLNWTPGLARAPASLTFALRTNQWHFA